MTCTGRPCAMLALFVIALVFGGASADWLQSVAISNLGSGGQVVFLTHNSGNSFVVNKGLSPDIPNEETPPNAAQSFDLGPEYPLGAFAIMLNGKYLAPDAAKTGVKLTTTATTWLTDDYGRIKVPGVTNPAAGLCLSTPSAALNTPVGLATCVKSKTQQWGFIPSQNAPSSLVYQIVEMNYANPLRMCLTVRNQTLDSTPELEEAPQWLACSPTDPKQQVVAVGDYPHGAFQLKFIYANTCLTARCPGCDVLLQGRINSVLTSSDCALTTDDDAYNLWLRNSRAQLQANLNIPGGQPGNRDPKFLPLCLSNGGVNVDTNANDDRITVDDCSRKRLTNRWILHPYA